MSFWRKIKQCSSLGRIMQIFHPCLCFSLSVLATASATKLNNRIIDNVKHLRRAAVSSQIHQQLLPTITGIATQQFFQFSDITSKDMYSAIHELVLT